MYGAATLSTGRVGRPDASGKLCNLLSVFCSAGGAVQLSISNPVGFLVPETGDIS